MPDDSRAHDVDFGPIPAVQGLKFYKKDTQVRSLLHTGHKSPSLRHTKALLACWREIQRHCLATLQAFAQIIKVIADDP